METCAIFKSIQSDARDAADLADEFIKVKLPAEKVKLELIQLLLRSTGIKHKIDENFIKDGEIADLVEFVENKSKEVRESTIPLHNAKFFKRCVSFFERVFLLDWNTFTNSGNFKTSYFINLLEELSECEPTMMHVLCFAIRLKLVTAYLRGACVEDEQKSMPQVKAYAKIMVEKAIFYRSIQCSISACTELYEWIKKDDGFATDRNLRLIVWSLKMEKPKLTCHALLIAYSLLRMEHLREQLVLFVRKLVSVFEDLCFIENNSVFDWICRCCEPIYKYHREAILPAFLEDLLDNLFAKSRSKAKSVAGFWINSVFDPNCHRTNIRTILKFLQDRGQEHWKVLVDSIIDDYPPMLDFKLLVEMLMDDESVPEEIRLTMEEKEGLLRLMSFAVEESVNGFPPEFRAENMKTLNMSTCHEYACKVTDALLPRFWDLFRSSYKNKERAQITLIFMAKFFNFASIERPTMCTFVQECVTMFKTSCQAFCYQVVLELLRLIMNTYRNPEVQHLCESVFATLKNYCESQLIELIDDLINDPDKYEDSSSEAVRVAETVSTRVVALNRFITLNKECSFDSTRRLLQSETQPRNQILLCIMYVSVGLMCDHIISSTQKLKEVCEMRQTRPEEYDDIMCDIDYTVKTLSIKLQEWYPWSDLSITTFLNLCKVLEALKDLSLMESTWNILVPPESQYLMIGFVAQMVWKTNNAEVRVSQCTKTWILKAFLRLIEQRVLPLFYAYDVMTCLHKERQVMEEPLREFIQGLCAIEEESIVVDWILNWMTCLFQLSSKDCVDVIGEFVELIYPIRKIMQNIICQVGKKGVDFAFGRETKQPHESPASRHEFLDVIVKLSECLDDKKKNTIEKYLKEAKFKKNDVKVVNSFLKRLKKKPAPRKADKSSSLAKPAESQESILSSRRASQITPEESEPPWSPSSISRSYSVLADESDLGSLDSSDMSLFLARSSKDNTTNLHDEPKVHSTPANEDETWVEDTLHVYGEMSELVQHLRATLASERTKSKTPSMSNRDGDITKELPNDSISDVDMSIKRTIGKNPLMSSDDDDMVSEPTKGNSPLLSSGDGGVTKGLANTSISDVDLESQRQENKSPSLSSGNDGIAKGWANTSISDVDFLEKSPMRNNQSVKSPLPSTQAESVSQVYNNISEFVNTLKDTNPMNEGASGQSLPMSVPGENDYIRSNLVNEPSKEVDFINMSPIRPTRVLQSPIMSPQAKENGTQAESISQVYDNIANFVEGLNQAPIDDLVLNHSVFPVVPSHDISNADLMETSPPTSSQLQGNNTQVESTSQMHENTRQLRKGLSAENSSASTSSSDENFMKKRLNTSISDLDSPATDPTTNSPVSKSSVSPSQTKRNNSQVISRSQEYENMKEFLQNLTAENSSASASSGDDEVMKNLLSTDLIDTSPLKSSPRANDNNTQDKSASQMQDDTRNFIDSLSADNSSASRSSGDDEVMKKRLNSSIDDSDSLPVSPMACSQVSESPSSSGPQSNSNQAPIDSVSQQFDSMRKYVKTLKKENSSDSTSSGDEDLLKFLQTTPTRPTQDAIDDTQDLYDILASDGEQQPDVTEKASKDVNDVVKNLQRVSLSNDESDETDSSSFCFGIPPSKKKRHS